VFEKQYQAVQGVRALKAVWKPGPALPAQREFHDTMRKMPSRDTLLVDSGDVDARLKQAAQVIRATYKHPYQMHASVGAACAVADVKGEAATIWSPTQGVYPQRDSCAMVLGLRPENVKVIFSRGSGCYGINGADTVSYDAALLYHDFVVSETLQLTRRAGRPGDYRAWMYLSDHGQEVGHVSDRAGHSPTTAFAVSHFRSMSVRSISCASAKSSRACMPTTASSRIAGWRPASSQALKKGVQSISSTRSSNG